jgi:PAS domain S-box-containing protein
VFEPQTLTIVDFNDEACRRLGYTHDEFSQLTICDIERIESTDEVKRHSQQVLATGTEVFETQHRTKSGAVLDIEVRAKAIRVGERVLIQGVWRDITERKRAEEALAALQHSLEEQVALRTQALRDNEAQLRAIVGTAADAIITSDEQGCILDVNQATERMFGYRAEELLGQNVKTLMPETQAEQHDGYLYRYFQPELSYRISTDREVVGRRKDGTTFFGELAVSELHDGQRIFVAILRDVSDRKELQAELLRSAEEEQRRIGQELHDDVQQQMTGLGLMAQSLADSLAVRTERASARRNLQNLATRIAEGLGEANRHIHRLSRGLIPVEVDAHGLQAALQELASWTCRTYPVVCRFAQEQSVQIADSLVATHLYRIAQEAINNALKHSGADQIEIRLRDADGALTLEVVDNGIGIEQQSSAILKSGGRGLRIMAHRASLVGATLCVQRAERRGTMVRCVLEKLGNTKQGEC